MNLHNAFKRAMVINRRALQRAANCRTPWVLVWLVFGLSAATPAWSWGGEGHRLICEIAWQQFTPATRGEVQALLRAERGSHRFADSCTWADRIRADRRYDDLKPWHYLNLSPGTTRYRDRDCPRAGCVVRAIDQARADLLDSSQSVPRRLEALKLLGHFVGDIHQPLHVAYASDRGGTQRMVRYGARPEPVDLHRVWDDLLLEGWAQDWRGEGQRLARGIGMRERRQWSGGDTGTWALESFRLTEDWVYSQAADGVIDETEIALNRSVVETQLRKAGWRLGVLLNGIFDPRAAAPVP